MPPQILRVLSALKQKPASVVYFVALLLVAVIVLAHAFEARGQAGTVVIAGRVTDCNGNGLSGHALSLTGSQTGNTTTNSQGFYSFSGLAVGGTYTVRWLNDPMPGPSGPANITYFNIQSSQSFNFPINCGAQEDIAGTYTGVTSNATASNCTDPFDNGGLFPVGVNVRLFPPTVNGATRTVTGLVTVAYAGPNGEDLILALSANLTAPGNSRTLSNGTLTVRPPFTGGGTFTGTWTRGTPDALNLTFDVSGTAFASTCRVTGNLNNTRLGPPAPVTFSQGILTQPQFALDPQVVATQQNGTFTIKPRAGVSNLHYNGFVSDDFINLNDYNIAVEVKQTATGGAETVFSIGDDPDNFYRFVKIDGNGTPAAFPDTGDESLRSEGENTTVTPAFLFFQIKVDGVPASFSIPYDPVAHRFWRFRHEKQDDTINFETSPDQATWTIRRKVANKKGVSEMTAELSAGTSNTVPDPGTAIFGGFMLGDNFSIAGQVKNTSNGGLAGVRVDLSGWTSLTTISDSTGKYSFAPLDAGKNYVVKFSLAGYSFPDQVFNALGSDKLVDIAATECAFTLASTNTSVSSAATTGSVALTSTGSDCARSAVSNAPWISITSGASGTGNGTVGFSIAANTTSVARSGTITIGGQTFTVNQAAPGYEAVTLTASQAEIKNWTVGGRTYAYLKLLFPNAGYRVTNWGTATKSANDFTADAAVERFTGPSVQAVTTTAQIYDLGPLANGTYNFNFKTSGTLAKTLSFTISSTVPPPNPIDDARQFVKQQYRDFLGREADPAGENFWTDNIAKCSDPARRPAGQTEAQCTLRQRETTSGAFFLSPEFQYTGYYVYRVYQGALGRQPKLSEFLLDAQFVGNGIVVNGQLSAAVINQNKAAFAAQFVNCTDATKYRCSEFKAIYDPLNNTQYVDKLFLTTGVNASASDRTALVNALNGATETRATVLQKIVDGITVVGEGNQQFTTTYGQAFYNSELTRAFVQLQYFGYMKRDPDDAGYAFWLGKLNQFGGNFVNAEMVLAFISSPEYRSRFGQP